MEYVNLDGKRFNLSEKAVAILEKVKCAEDYEVTISYRELETLREECFVKALGASPPKDGIYAAYANEDDMLNTEESNKENCIAEFSAEAGLANGFATKEDAIRHISLEYWMRVLKADHWDTKLIMLREVVATITATEKIEDKEKLELINECIANFYIVATRKKKDA